MAREHFGITLGESKYGYKLNRDNFAIVNNKGSFGNGKIYDEEWCKEKYKRCMKNFDINMQRLNSLDVNDFEREIDVFLEYHPLFQGVKDLKLYDHVSGYYMMVLDNYCQVYIGTSDNIKQRIMKHWSKVLPFDRVIFGTVETSIISIDSYRAFDTTRIYVYKTNDIFTKEEELINSINPTYCCNRTKGGQLSNLKEAVMDRKIYNEQPAIKNYTSSSQVNNIEVQDDEILTITDLTAVFHCTRHKIKNYYAMYGLPLEKNGNRYIIKKSKLLEWEDMMEKQRISRLYIIEKQRKEAVNENIKSLLVGIIIVIGIIVLGRLFSSILFG